jgi:SAM-dependent methyltransferase
MPWRSTSRPGAPPEMPHLPMSIPQELEALRPDVPPALFDATFRGACERLDRFVGALALELAATLDLPNGPPLTADAIVASRDWSPDGALALAWLLETLELYGAADRSPEGWALVCPAPSVPSAALRIEAERMIPAARPAYEVLSLCAGALPAVLRGEVRGEEALFSASTLGLWFEYFSNANPHYGPNNALAGVAAARATRHGTSVLEFGGGGGSAAEAILRALSDAGKPPARYVFTELQPAFLRRGTRAAWSSAPEGCELSAAKFDINLDPAEQGLEPASFDLVFGVNTLHLAHDLLGTLENLRVLLGPRGALVVGELVRPTPDAPVHLELPFTLLQEYRNAQPIPGIRSRPGFMSARGWVRALESAGFSQITVLPAQIERCAEVYPGFYSGAITARV